MIALRRFLTGLRWPIALILVNYAIASVLALRFGEALSDWIFITGRVVVTVLAGWLVVVRSLGGMWHAALAGALLMLIDHVLLKGGYYLFVHFLAPESLPFSSIQSFAGVLISYVVFLWVPMCVAIFGALAARVYRRLWPPNPQLQANQPQAACR